MKSVFKEGKCINDKQVKFTKKYFKSNPIPYEINERCYEELKDSVIKVTNLRKYKSNFYGYFEFEVDVIVDIRYDGYAYSNDRLNRRKRTYNSFYRDRLEKRIMEELKFFGIESVRVCKITYQKID